MVVTAAPADVAGHTQFVVGVRAKQCRLNLHAAVASPLAADFQIAADCRLQIECQSRAAVRALAPFIETWRLEALSGGTMSTPTITGSPVDTSHRTRAGVARSPALYRMG